MEDKLVEELNRLYFSDPERYIERLTSIKDAGYKVFRNSAGKHKVTFDIYDSFSGIFGDIFGRSTK